MQFDIQKLTILQFWFSRLALSLSVIFINPEKVHAADLLTFCLGTAPTDPTQSQIYFSQCPAYLQSQFSNSFSANQLSQQSSQLGLTTTQLAQQKAQLDLLTSLAAMGKGPTAVPSSGSGFDVSGLAGRTQLMDAKLSYSLAKRVGTIVGSKLNPAKPPKGPESLTLLPPPPKVIYGTSTEISALLASPVDAATVVSTLTLYDTKLRGATCTQASANDLNTMSIIPGALPAIIGIDSLLNSLANTASMFQPSLYGIGKGSNVQDANAVMAAGLADGLSNNRGLVYFRVPTITANNSALAKFETVRDDITQAILSLTKCKADATATKVMSSLVTEAANYLTGLTKTETGKPSLLDLAARRIALEDAGIKYTLVLSKDAALGGVAAVRPTIFASVKLLFGHNVAISYQLMSLDGIVLQSGIESDSWAERREIDHWADPDKPVATTTNPE